VNRALVLAKSPVPGRVKTRLGADVGMAHAAELAASALLDTLAACAGAFGYRQCRMALSGDLGDAVRGEEVRRALRGWTVLPQRGRGFGDRLVNAHLDLAREPGGVVQIGMDTPQVTPGRLTDVAERLRHHEAVLGQAPDGGWWVLGLRRPADADALRTVGMSTPTTGRDTLAALRGAGIDVGSTTQLRDVDTVDDADAVARQAPGSRFAETWARLAGEGR
jgi:glycosyltransferase A (GT-A) superfamily protein (DUF2064 family)